MDALGKAALSASGAGGLRASMLLSASPVQAEPVSPELVLIDPELARRERAKLEERAQLRAIHEADDLRRALEVTLATTESVDDLPSRRRAVAVASGKRILAAALFCSLLANGFLAAKLVSRNEVASSAAAFVPAPAVRANAVPKRTSGVAARDTVKANAREAERIDATKASVEQKLVSLMLAAPARKLPRAFRDPNTGLLKNNVHVTCQRSTNQLFQCVIRMPSASARGGLFVRYRALGTNKGEYRWLGYHK